MKSQWIIVFILVLLIIGITVFAMLNPNEPPTSVLSEFMSEEQINNFNTIVSKCGITVDKIVRDDSLDELDGENTIGFRIRNKYSNNIILYVKNGTVKSIRFADNYLYNEGNFLGRLSDYL